MASFAAMARELLAKMHAPLFSSSNYRRFGHRLYVAKTERSLAFDRKAESNANSYSESYRHDLTINAGSSGPGIRTQLDETLAGSRGNRSGPGPRAN